MSARFLKRVALSAAAAIDVPAIPRRLLRDRGLVFMLHRFRNPDLGLPGHDPEELRRSLGFLRRRGSELVSLEELLRRLASPTSGVHGAIAFTIDDGYADQASIGLPIFAEFDCPVTTFVTTGFLDGALWFWWDRIAYVFSRISATSVRVRVGSQPLEFRWSCTVERDRACHDFTQRCKALEETTKLRAIDSLAAEAGVEVPTHPPAEYAPVSWDDVRSWEARGMSFGPHTVTHPVLSRTENRQSEHEIDESWRRLRAEARAPTPVFCYPNGQPGDFGEREFRTLTRAGFLGAVVGTAGYASAAALRGDTASRFAVPRYSWPGDVPTLAQYASGLERLKQLVLRRV